MQRGALISEKACVGIMRWSHTGKFKLSRRSVFHLICCELKFAGNIYYFKTQRHFLSYSLVLCLFTLDT